MFYLKIGPPICSDFFANFGGGGGLHITFGNMNGFVGWLLQTICLCCSPNARTSSAALICDKEDTATFLFKVLWVSFC